MPTPAEEDRRQVHRELLFARRDRGRHTNRIKGLLASEGVPLARIQELATHLATARLWDGTPRATALVRPPGARMGRGPRLHGAHPRTQSGAAGAAPHPRRSGDRPGAPAQLAPRRRDRQRLTLRDGVLRLAPIPESASGRGLAGLTDTHYQNGDLQHEQAISKAGNRWVRALAINTAWAWLRFQPQSALARWYQTKFGNGSSRVRKIGIVALARKLLIAFWRYLDTGRIPEGAVLRA